MKSPRLLVAFLICVVLAPLAAAENVSTWRESKTGIEFVRIPEGSYEQGCGPWTSECRDAEKPVRRVTLSPFWLGRTEVTQGQWKRVMDSNPAAFKKGDDHPVEQVSWDDAQEFIKRLNMLVTGEIFRLPTEAEWEYACRAGGKKIAYGTKSGNLDENSAQYGRHKSPAPVARYPANGLGLHDMSGNVGELVQDIIDLKGYPPGDVINPRTEAIGGFKGYRGGAFFSTPVSVRCSHRKATYNYKRNDYIGLRLARGKFN